MFPIEICLVAEDGEARREIQTELNHLEANVSQSFQSIGECYSLFEPSTEDLYQFLVEVRSADDIVWLEKLNNHFVGHPILAVVHVTKDAGLLVSAMRAGAAQVVRYPLDPVDFQKAMSRVATQFGHAPQICDVIPVISTNSGAGATSVSLNLSTQIARSFPVRVLLVEGNLSFGVLPSRLNIAPRVTTQELIHGHTPSDRERICQAMTKIHQDFRVLTGPYHSIHEESNDLQALASLLHDCQQLTDVLIVDMPPVVGPHYFEYLKSVDQIVIVCEQRIESVEGMKVFLDKFKEHEINARLIPVINKYDPKFEELTPKRIKELLQLPDIFTIRHDDKIFRQAETEGKTLYQISFRDKVLEDFDLISRFILHQTARREKVGFFSKIFHRH